jgi:NAD(P)-dependent dehydrogenase (short-subunit alcohol dehydrogenase family)
MNVSNAVLITGCSSGIGWATAEAIEYAVSDRNPRSRYAVVTPSAHLFMRPRRLRPCLA